MVCKFGDLNINNNRVASPKAPTYLGEFLETLRLGRLEPSHEVGVGEKVTLTGRVTGQSKLAGVLTQGLAHLVALG